MIAVCLLTADRYEYTKRTLDTFAAHNDVSRFLLLHADDASHDREVPALAREYGFHTVVQSRQRKGWQTMRLALFERASMVADWILFLENDCEWVRPFPWPLFTFVQKYTELYCLRLQGRFKGRGVDPCMEYHKLNRNKPVKWKPLKKAPEPAQVGFIHWSAQPSVTRTAELLELHRRGRQSGALTARVVENVTIHIGHQRTQALKATA